MKVQYKNKSLITPYTIVPCGEPTNISFLPNFALYGKKTKAKQNQEKKYYIKPQALHPYFQINFY